MIRMVSAILLFLQLASCRKETNVEFNVPQFTIGIQDNMISGLFVLAEQKGFFRQEGLNIEIVSFPSGKRAHNAMLRGEIDMATVGVTPFAIWGDKAVSQGIASIGSAPLEMCITARRDHGITTPQDLVGKRIATQENSGVHFFLSMFLLKHLIPEDSVEIIYMKAEELPNALENGSIDAFSMRDPFSEEAEKLLGDKITHFHYPIKSSQMLLAAKPEWIHAHNSICKKVLQAIINAEAYLSEHPEEAEKILIEVFPEEVLREFNLEVSLQQSLLILFEEVFNWKYPDTLEYPRFNERVNTMLLKDIAPDKMDILL